MHGAFWMQAPDLRARSPATRSRPAVRSTRSSTSGRRTRTAGWRRSPTTADTGRQLGQDRWDAAEDRRRDALEQGDAWWKKYHVFSVEWTPDGLHLPRRRPGDLPADQEHLRGAGVPGAQPAVLGLGAARTSTSPQLPADMKVDWVRVWQPPPAVSRRRLVEPVRPLAAPAGQQTRVAGTRPDSARQNSKASIVSCSPSPRCQWPPAGPGQLERRTARRAARPTPAPRRRRSRPRGRRSPRIGVPVARAMSMRCMNGSRVRITSRR